MKKILYLVSNAELGGAQRYILDLAKNLKNEYEITVAYGVNKDKDDITPELKEEPLIKTVIVPYFQKPLDLTNDIRAYFKIKKLLLELKPDIVHLCGFKASLLASLATKNISEIVSPKIIYTAHGWAFKRFENFFKRTYYYIGERYTAKWKDRIICINNLDIETAKNILKVNEHRLALIHNGFDISQYNYLSKEEAREKLFSKISNARIPDEKTILIGSIGKLHRDKGYYFLIKALHYLIIDYGYPITAIIIGEGHERKDLEERIVKFHPMDYSSTDGDVSNKIILAGHIPNAAQYLHAFDFYISTSLKDGFPYTILEAMGAGLPLVATETYGITEIINNQNNGILIEPRNSKLLAKTISDLIKKPELAKKISENARYDINHHFGFNDMIMKTKEVYENFN